MAEAGARIGEPGRERTRCFSTLPHTRHGCRLRPIRASDPSESGQRVPQLTSGGGCAGSSPLIAFASMHAFAQINSELPHSRLGPCGEPMAIGGEEAQTAHEAKYARSTRMGCSSSAAIHSPDEWLCTCVRPACAALLLAASPMTKSGRHEAAWRLDSPP